MLTLRLPGRHKNELFSRGRAPLLHSVYEVQLRLDRNWPGRRNPDNTGTFRPIAQSPAHTTRSGLRRAIVLQATKSYRGFESDALRHSVCKDSSSQTE